MLRALDGSNPLAFLAALGAFRLLTLETQQSIRMSWGRQDGFWRPKFRGVQATEEELCRKLAESHRWAPAEELIANLHSKNITVSKSTFKEFVEAACKKATPQDRRTADFAAAFGCEVCEEEDKDRIECTDFCFITGSGHQDFLGAISKLEANVNYDHLYDALFGKWKTESATGMSMRWDPSDAAEYALQWKKPSSEGAGAVLGANRLAIEALPFFPTAPSRNGLETTGFQRRERLNEFTWPIWSHWAGFASVRSLLGLAEFHTDTELENNRDTSAHKALLVRGIEAVYRSQRAWIGEGKNRKVNFQPARGV
jgi:hypothetical protein